MEVLRKEWQHLIYQSVGLRRDCEQAKVEGNQSWGSCNNLGERWWGLVQDATTDVGWRSLILSTTQKRSQLDFQVDGMWGVRTREKWRVTESEHLEGQFQELRLKGLWAEKFWMKKLRRSALDIIKVKISISRQVAMLRRQLSLGFRREVWAGDAHLGVSRYGY